jgi:hypothetical protein
MTSRRIRVNRRSAISLLLAVLILAIAVTPVLAEEDEGQGGRGSAAGQALISDDDMGFLSLKTMHPTVIIAETPAFVQVANDEEGGYLSLKGASYARTRTLVQATDESRGYLSLRGARQFIEPAPERLTQPYLVLVDDDAMGFLSLRTANDMLAIVRSEALVSAK